MQSHEVSDAPTHPVILIEGERDLKPRPEAYVKWTDGFPPGGPMPPGGGKPSEHLQWTERAGDNEHGRRRFLVKVAGVGEQPGELDEEPLTVAILTWLAEALNREQTRLMTNPSRGWTTRRKGSTARHRPDGGICRQ